MLALAGALLATATLLANRSTADEAVFAVFVAAKLVVTFALLPVAGLVLANARTIATTQRRPERWLIRFDIEVAAIAVVASVVSFVDRDWLAPGELVAAGAWFLVAFWVVVLGADHLERRRRHLLGGKLMNRSAHRAPEPVHRTILVPLDGSHLAAGALAMKLTLVTVAAIATLRCDDRAPRNPRPPPDPTNR